MRSLHQQLTLTEGAEAVVGQLDPLEGAVLMDVLDGALAITWGNELVVRGGSVLQTDAAVFLDGGEGEHAGSGGVDFSSCEHRCCAAVGALIGLLYVYNFIAFTKNNKMRGT